MFRGRKRGLPMFGAAVPIKVSDGVAAVLVVGSEGEPGPKEQDVEVFRMLASQASLALENVRRFEEQRQVIERLADSRPDEERLPLDRLARAAHPADRHHGDGAHARAPVGNHRRSRSVPDFLTRLNANAATLDHVIGQLLDFSKLEAGQLRPDTREIDLSKLLPEIVDRLASLLEGHQVELDVASGVSTQADPGLIERIVENLLSNASKYTPVGSRVIVSAHEDGPDHVIVAVSDDGPGIPESEVARIGERFFRGGDVHTRSTRGTGLGLAVVSEIPRAPRVSARRRESCGRRLPVLVPPREGPDHRSAGIAGEKTSISRRPKERGQPAGRPRGHRVCEGSDSRR